MRLAWLTDVHLDFVRPEQRPAFYAAVRESGPEALLVGGDTGEADVLETFLRELEQELERPIYFVLGNHDYYRGTVADVREGARKWTETTRYLRYLPLVAPIDLGGGSALIGHDGWGDGRLGDFAHSNVLLNDFEYIEDLARVPDRAGLLALLNRLGDDAAASVSAQLAAASAYSSLLFLTHVPPFQEAAWHEGRMSNPDWLPYFSCKAVGDVLLRAADERRERRIDILCGHTHGAGRAVLRQNLVAVTAGAVYGRPRFQIVETGAAAVAIA